MDSRFGGSYPSLVLVGWTDGLDAAPGEGRGLFLIEETPVKVGLILDNTSWEKE